MRAIEWLDGGDIRILDQTGLPHSEAYRTLRSTEEIAEAIRSMRVRGAPALGIVGAMGAAQAALRATSKLPNAVLARAREAGRVLAGTRPTAVNLRWGIDRVLERGASTRGTAGRDIARVMVEEALAVQSEDEKACLSMAEHALGFFPPEGVVLTHCNTGALCTGGNGTALGAIRHAHDEGRRVVVLATETRPLLQGARLTAWELGKLGIPHAVVVDAAGPGLIARGEVALVVVGADRIAANGDVVNKVGTYGLALAAREAGVPFVVVAPTSTIDGGTRDGSRVPLEERPDTEVTWILGRLEVTPHGTSAVNPAFDMTPAGLVSAIVTERGIARPPYASSISRLLSARPEPARAAPKKPGRKPPGKPPAPKPARASKAKAKPRRAPVEPSAAKKRPSAAKKKAAPKKTGRAGASKGRPAPRRKR